MQKLKYACSSPYCDLFIKYRKKGQIYEGEPIQVFGSEREMYVTIRKLLRIIQNKKIKTRIFCINNEIHVNSKLFERKRNTDYFEN